MRTTQVERATLLQVAKSLNALQSPTFLQEPEVFERLLNTLLSNLLKIYLMIWL